MAVEIRTLYEDILDSTKDKNLVRIMGVAFVVIVATAVVVTLL